MSDRTEPYEGGSSRVGIKELPDEEVRKCSGSDSDIRTTREGVDATRELGKPSGHATDVSPDAVMGEADRPRVNEGNVVSESAGHPETLRVRAACHDKGCTTA